MYLGLGLLVAQMDEDTGLTICWSNNENGKDRLVGIVQKGKSNLPVTKYCVLQICEDMLSCKGPSYEL